MVKVCLAAVAVLLFACGNKPKGPGCKTDKDCKAPLVCGDNKCVQCNTDAQCGAGKKCSQHACVAKAECTPLHRGRTTMVWQTRITRGDGKLCALVTQTQLVLERRK